MGNKDIQKSIYKFDDDLNDLVNKVGHTPALRTNGDGNSVPLIEWTDEFDINVRELDGQNRALVKKINELFFCLRGYSHQIRAYTVLNELKALIETNFLNEERIMERYEYHIYKSHKKEHNKLSKEVQKIVKRCRLDDIETLEKMAIFLKDWLIKHIMEEDKEMGNYLNNKGVT